MFEKEKTTIYLGNDHAGFEMKEMVKKHLEDGAYKIVDLGTFSDESVDYPDFAEEVAEKVLETEGAFGVLVCGTGIGICMSANRFKGVRAGMCRTVEDAEATRKHNDANVLCLGGRVTDMEVAKQIVDKFLTTDFESGEDRHVRRVKKMDEMGK
jgi:ribose 5-phosphate isomerase B